MDTGNQREPPLTTTPVPEVVEPRPLEDWKPFDELEELEDDVLDEEVSVLDVAAVLADGLDEVDEEVDVPGMVAALTALKSPTPATAARAAPVVTRLSIRIAASLASILASVCLFMVWKLGAPR